MFNVIEYYGNIIRLNGQSIGFLLGNEILTKQKKLQPTAAAEEEEEEKA